MKRSILKSLFFKVVLALFALSCGLDDEKESADLSYVGSKKRESCSKLADKFDECLYDVCNRIKYSCKVCSCMKSDGSNCMYSAHKKLDDCTEEENEEAEYMLDYVYCSEYLEGFERLCPPPETNVCNREYDYCITHMYDNGICMPLDSNENVCTKICLSIGSSVECYSDKEACYPIDNKKGVCIYTGDKKVGDKCIYTNDCEGGSVCIGNEEENEYRCYRVCNNNSSCGIEGVCTDTGMGYKVCVSE